MHVFRGNFWLPINRGQTRAIGKEEEGTDKWIRREAVNSGILNLQERIYYPWDVSRTSEHNVRDLVPNVPM